MIVLVSAFMYCCPILALCPIKIKLKEFLILLLTVILSSFVINSFFNHLFSYFVVIFLLFILVYYKTSNIFMGLLFSILSFLMGVFGEVILANLLVLLYANINSFINGTGFVYATYKTYDASIIEQALRKFSLIYLFIMAFFPYILSKPIGHYIKKKTQLENYEKPSLLLKSILFLLIIMFIWYYTSLAIGESTGRKDVVLASLANLLPLAFFALFMVAFYSLKILERDSKIKTQKETMKQLQQYTESIENLYNSLKSFRHDYINLLSTMSIFITEKRYDELEHYYSTKILPLHSKISDDIYKLSLLSNIKIVELKSIVAYKAILAQEKNISFIVDILDEISSINFNIIDLSKIIGILIDNAIEESQQCQLPYIKFCILLNNESKSIIVANRCKQDLPAINDMFSTGFSTKGNDRGIGLSILKEIIDNNENCLLETKKENDEFKIKIDIYDEVSC